MSEVYKPPPTIADFICSEERHNYIVGPFGSGKTTGILYKIIYHASRHPVDPSTGIRKSRAAVIRNTGRMLDDTTLVSWRYWFHDGVHGQWRETKRTFTLKFGDIECEVIFRQLDTPDDIRNVKSLEVNYVVLDEFIEIDMELVQALDARLGRYKPYKEAEAGWKGMWGASNPGLEDNVWFDYLFKNRPDNVKYFQQPSGFSPLAENVENLPDGRDYYTILAQGKSKDWINQYINAEWGYSVSGKSVLQAFNPEIHVSKEPIPYNPHLPLVVGLDPGVSYSACIIGQQDLNGRLLVLNESIQQQMGAQRMMIERLNPLLRSNYPDADIVIAPDPAANVRSQSDERTVVDMLRKHYKVSYQSNNQMMPRLEAMDHFASRLIPGVGPALLIDGVNCPKLLRALKGGWRYSINRKGITDHDPEKNEHSHPGDAFSYLCRHFHVAQEKYMSMMRRPLPTQKRYSYHAR